MNVEHSIFINIWYLRATVNILLWELFVWEKKSSRTIIGDWDVITINIYRDKRSTIISWEDLQRVWIVQIIVILNDYNFMMIYHKDKKKILLCLFWFRISCSVGRCSEVFICGYSGYSECSVTFNEHWQWQRLELILTLSTGFQRDNQSVGSCSHLN